jgi:fatty acid desaturase
MAIAAEATVLSECADSYQHLRKTLIPIDRVRVLSQLRPGRVIWDTAWCWAWILAAWTVVALRTSWWTVLLAIPVIGCRYYALFIIGHDGLHRRLFRRTWANDLFNDLFCYGPIGAITHINNKNHLTHHHYVGTDQDPDRHKYTCLNKATGPTLLGYLSGVRSIFLSVKHVFWDRTRPVAEQHPSLGSGNEARYGLRDLAILVGWQTVLIGGLTWAIGWWAYPVLWMLPIFLFTVLADNFRTFAEHSHPEPDDLADRHRLITYLSNPVERWFCAPMNMNYHAAHHLWPSIPYYNLPEADEILRRGSPSEGMEWRRSYLGYLWRYWLNLPLTPCLAPASSGSLAQTGARIRQER